MSSITGKGLKPREDVYIKGYRKARKHFKNLLKESEDMRKEQLAYILNSLKLLCVFLQSI